MMLVVLIDTQTQKKNGKKTNFYKENTERTYIIENDYVL